METIKNVMYVIMKLFFYLVGAPVVLFVFYLIFRIPELVLVAAVLLIGVDLPIFPWGRK